MIVRKAEDIRGTDREVSTDEWTSYRLLLKKDGMGFSLHETLVRAGTKLHVNFKNHLEAVYCMRGEGSVHDLDNGKIHSIGPGTLYALNNHENHILEARTDILMICVFNPALTGRETHDEDGSYPLLDA